jgi:hypothetical protein
MWFGPNGLTLSIDLPATIVNHVCGQPGNSGAPVTVNNRLVGHDPRRLHRGPAHLHRLVHPLHTPAVTMSMNAVIGDVTLMTGLVGGANYSMNQASYDLARLGINGLITRIPGRNRYRLTHDGLAFAIFYPKVHDRLLRPLLAADEPPAPRRYEKRCTPLTFTSHNASRMPGCCPS